MKGISAIIFLVLGLSGCATAPSYIKPAAPVVQSMPGIYHRVEKGQTLWRISKIYGVDLDELAQVNHIADSTAVETGQQVFIPNRSKPQAYNQPVSARYNDNDDFIWPVRGRITGSFGKSVDNMLNKGINIQPYVSSQVLASRSGKVVFLSNNFAGLGKTVIIEHGDGLFTVYGRNSEIFVRPGDNVQKGSAIAKVGSSGRGRGAYLHFEVRKGHISQNPLFYLP